MNYAGLLIAILSMRSQADWQPTLRTPQWSAVEARITFTFFRGIEDFLNEQQRIQFDCNRAHAKIRNEETAADTSTVSFHTHSPMNLVYYGRWITSNLCDPVEIPKGMSSEDALQMMFRALNDMNELTMKAYRERENEWKAVIASYERLEKLRERQVEMLTKSLDEVRKDLGYIAEKTAGKDSRIKQ